MSFEERFYKVLEAQSGERGWQRDLSAHTGIPQNTLSQIVNRTTKSPGLDKVGQIIDAIGAEAFLDAPATMHRMGVNSPVEAVEGSGLPRVPVLGTAGAGAPQEFWSTEPETVIEVLPQYARPRMVGLKIDGDSMEPTIQRGACVGVVPLEGDIEEGGVYLVHVPPFGRVVKRIRMGDEGAIELYSDNPKYPPRRLPLEQYEQVVIGKVVWVWQMM